MKIFFIILLCVSVHAAWGMQARTVDRQRQKLAILLKRVKQAQAEANQLKERFEAFVRQSSSPEQYEELQRLARIEQDKMPEPKPIDMLMKDHPEKRGREKHVWFNE